MIPLDRGCYAVIVPFSIITHMGKNTEDQIIRIIKDKATKTG